MKIERHDDFVEHVCELLAPLGVVRAKRMFGGWGVYVDEVFMAIIANDTLWFKVDDGNRAAYAAAGSQAFRPFPDRDTVMSYWLVPADVMDDRLAIVAWGREAIAAGERARTKKRPRR
jgi:DNA transformation protein